MEIRSLGSGRRPSDIRQEAQPCSIAPPSPRRRFASAATLRQFEQNPEAYAPQFGGYCAWAVSQHYLAPGDPRQWKIVGGRLYLNANARAKQLWEADQADAIARGHANRPAVLTDNQDSP